MPCTSSLYEYIPHQSCLQIPNPKKAKHWCPAQVLAPEYSQRGCNCGSRAVLKSRPQRAETRAVSSSKSSDVTSANKAKQMPCSDAGRGRGTRKGRASVTVYRRSSSVPSSVQRAQREAFTKLSRVQKVCFFHIAWITSVFSEVDAEVQSL